MERLQSQKLALMFYYEGCSYILNEYEFKIVLLYCNSYMHQRSEIWPSKCVVHAQTKMFLVITMHAICINQWRLNMFLTLLNVICMNFLVFNRQFYFITCFNAC